MDVFLAGITTIPYFAAVKMHGDYYVEGGYIDNIPLRTLFADPEVDEIIAVDFTDRDYHAELDDVYGKNPLMLLLNSIDMNLLVTDIQMNLPGDRASSARRSCINRMLQAAGRTTLEIDGRVYRYKPLHVLRPHNLKSMTIALGDSSLQKKYFELGQREVAGTVRRTCSRDLDGTAKRHWTFARSAKHNRVSERRCQELPPCPTSSPKPPPSTSVAADPERGFAAVSTERRAEPRLPPPAIPVEERREITDAITFPRADAPSTTSPMPCSAA